MNSESSDLPHTPPVENTNNTSDIENSQRINENKQRLEKYKQEQLKITAEMTRHQITEILGISIKHDKASTQVLFYGLINNYTESDQLNFSITGPSSVGKTYLPGEILRVFPQEDIHWKGYTSPKAFYYEKGALQTKDGSPVPEFHDYLDDKIKPWLMANPKPQQRDGIGEWREKYAAKKAQLRQMWENIDKYIVVDLHQKILVFLDQPSDALQVELRPILSHDRKQIETSIVNRSKDGPNRIMKVLIQGYPTLIGSSVAYLPDEQEQTRHIQLSPEASQDKFRDTIKHQAHVLSDKNAFKNAIETDLGLKLLTERIKRIKNSIITEVLINQNDSDYIYSRFIDQNPTLKPRHQRDFPRIIAFAKSHALFNQWSRESSPDGTTIYVSRHDIDEAFNILEPLLESNEQGIPPYEFNFYKESLKPALNSTENGLHKNEISKLYFNYYKTRIGQHRRDKMVNLFLETGLVFEDLDPQDKRRKKIYATPPVGENTPKSDTSYTYTVQENCDRIIELVNESSSSPTTKEIATRLSVPLDELEKLLTILENDKSLFQPFPGFWKRL